MRFLFKAKVEALRGFYFELPEFLIQIFSFFSLPSKCQKKVTRKLSLVKFFRVFTGKDSNTHCTKKMKFSKDFFSKCQ